MFGQVGSGFFFVPFEFQFHASTHCQCNTQMCTRARYFCSVKGHRRVHVVCNLAHRVPIGNAISSQKSGNESNGISPDFRVFPAGLIARSEWFHPPSGVAAAAGKPA